MPRNLLRPGGLGETGWGSITASLDRLERAERDRDHLLIIGCAKELVEATARVVMVERGEAVPSNEDYLGVVNRAHQVLERQPGPELADDPPVRNIAQAAKTIATQLRDLRNRYGTGHGRASVPEIPEEIVAISVDAALLWSGWALRRLNRYISGRPSSLARELREGAVFRAGSLARRLLEADLPSLDTADQHLLGLAVAQRAREGTFVVAQDGVDACAGDRSLERWPLGYRAGVVEGLFLDRSGYVDVTSDDSRQAASILAPHPDASGLLTELAAKLAQAGLSNRLTSNDDRRTAVVTAMSEAASQLPGPARDAWIALAQGMGSARFEPES